MLTFQRRDELVPVRKRLTATNALSMLVFCGIICSGVFSASAAPRQASPNELQVKFVVSQPCSLLKFINILAERGHTTTWEKEWYDRQCETLAELSGQRASDKEPLATYRKLIEGANKQYKFQDCFGRTRDICDFALMESAFCSTDEELLARLKTKLNKTDLETFSSAIDHFRPVFEKLVWKPQANALAKQLNDYETSATTTKLNEKLTTVRRFLKSSWPINKPFVVVLSPLPKGSKSTSGNSMGQVQTIELSPDNGFEDKADVVFHEAVHALWFTMKDERQKVEWFRIPDKGSMPLTELYEGIATAFGQGWFAEKAFGHVVDNWYNDENIEKYSRAIYPLCKSYIDQNRALDREFAEAATQIYFRNFADTDKIVKQADSIVVFTNAKGSFDLLRSRINSGMPRLRSWGVSIPITARESVKEFKTSSRRMIFLMSPKDSNQLKALGLSRDDISRVAAVSNGLLTLKFRDKTLLFCLAESEAEQQRLFFEVLNQKTWPS
jgi:hypothetical protein